MIGESTVGSRHSAVESRVAGSSRFLFVAVGAAAILSAACALACGSSPATPKTPELPGPETSQLVAALRGLGASADIIEVLPESSNPGLAVPSVRVLVNGANVWVFEYASVSEASAQAALVSGDGSSIGTTQIHWVSTPHFFRGNRLIVLYVGNDAAVTRTLERLLGAQFAGR